VYTCSEPKVPLDHSPLQIKISLQKGNCLNHEYCSMWIFQQTGRKLNSFGSGAAFDPKFFVVGFVLHVRVIPLCCYGRFQSIQFFTMDYSFCHLM